MTRIKTILFWFGLVPAIIVVWGTISTAVYFIDDVQYIRSVVTKDAVKNFNADIAIINMRLSKLEKR